MRKWDILVISREPDACLHECGQKYRTLIAKKTNVQAPTQFAQNFVAIIGTDPLAEINLQISVPLVSSQTEWLLHESEIDCLDRFRRRDL